MRLFKTRLVLLLALAGIIGLMPVSFIAASQIGSAESVMNAGGPNEDCPSGTVLIAKFNRNDGDNGAYVFEKPAGNSSVVIITSNGNNSTGANWTSTQTITHIIVKGGTKAVTNTVPAPGTSGSFTNSNLPPNPGGKPPAISNVQFCGPEAAPTATNTSVPPTATNTNVPPTATNTEVPPTETPTATDEVCPAGTELIAKFEWKGSGYVFEKPDGNEDIVDINGDENGGTWTSSLMISHVILKGGTNTHTYAYNPAVTSGSFDKNDIPVNNGGNHPDISNIQFCGNGDAPTNTPTEVPPTATNTAVPPSVSLNLTAECAVGDVLYWRVTNNSSVASDFSWQVHNTAQTGNGTVEANAKAYFTTTDVGGANTTILRWIDPATNTQKQVTKAHNNWPCVSHISIAKVWEDSQGVPDGVDLSGFQIVATSSIDTLTCVYDAGALKCSSTYYKNDAEKLTLEVPFGESYSVNESGGANYVIVSGTGSGFEHIDGILLPGFEYDLNEDSVCAPVQGQLAKYCVHTVTNRYSPPPTATNTPVPPTDEPTSTNEPDPVCETGYAVEVVLFIQGETKGNGTVLADRSNPDNALGAPQNSDASTTIENFVSLGFDKDETAEREGELVLRFDGRAIPNPNGVDITLVETSFGSPTFNNYPEQAEVFVGQSANGPWFALVPAFAQLDTSFEFPAGLEWATHIRILDASLRSSGKFPGSADGYDVDGVTACVEEFVPTATPTPIPPTDEPTATNTAVPPTDEPTATPTDDNGNPNESCPTGTFLIAKFEWQGGSYVQSEGTPGIVTVNGDETGGTWSSTTPISVVIIKGATGTHSYTPNGATNGSFSKFDLPLNNGGQAPDISNIQFCAPQVTNTPTNTPVPPTDEPTATPTNTPVPPTDEPTATPTNTPVPPTDEPTATPTNTPVPPTDEPTATPTNTPVPPTETPTDNPTSTPTPLGTEDPTPVGTEDVTPEV
jgi:hypothetical protein